MTLTGLDRPAATAEELLRAVGLRDQARPTVAEATVVRRRAFALFMRVYARARAAVQYLRAELGDADDVAPSLYAGRAKRKKNEGETLEASPASPDSGNEPGAIPPPSEQPRDGAAPAAERPTAAEAVGEAEVERSPAAAIGMPVRVAQLFGMLLSGRGPPVAKA
ncbi:MAG: hypothetical protein JW940_30200 [Polyangiaceae bacterium]|nr:hypothetical protein [Polyangiaceae bacterium]